jgi:hypothetical protein
VVADAEDTGGRILLLLLEAFFGLGVVVRVSSLSRYFASGSRTFSLCVLTGGDVTNGSGGR